LRSPASPAVAPAGQAPRSSLPWVSGPWGPSPHCAERTLGHTWLASRWTVCANDGARLPLQGLGAKIQS
jgi:hypothetical protein